MGGSAVAEDTFEQEVPASTQPVIVDFWAPWCGPCLALAPALDESATERAGELKVVKVNVDQEPGLAVRFGIMSIPTIVLFQRGAVVAGAVGPRGKVHLERALDLAPRDAVSATAESGWLQAGRATRASLVAVSRLGRISYGRTPVEEA